MVSETAMMAFSFPSATEAILPFTRHRVSPALMSRPSSVVSRTAVVVLTVLVVWDLVKKVMPFTKLERWLIVCIYAGGLGNMIDRLRLGYVVDMIEVEFMNFAVFNVADCFITCGCILLMLHLIFCNKEFWKDEKKK